MPVKQILTADMSTTHLSMTTRDWIDNPRSVKPFTPLERDEGWMISTHCVGDENHVLPRDLSLALAFAKHNGSDFVLFDRDGDILDELPTYDDGNKIIDKGTLLTASASETSMASVNDYEDDPDNWHEVADLDALRAHFGPSGPTLSDADYRLPEGGWFETGGVSVRIRASADGSSLDISAHPLGREDDDAATLTASSIDLDDVRAMSAIDNITPGF